MSDTHSTSTPTPQPNDAAARSPTGEILDVRPPPTPEPKPTETKPPVDSTATTTDPTKTTPAATTSPDSSQPKLGPDGKPVEPAKPAPTGAPAAYTDFTLPEGVTLSPQALEAATPIFKKLGLSQEAAQELVAFHAGQLKDLAAAPAAVVQRQNAEWLAAVNADAEIKAHAVDGKTGADAVRIDIGRGLSSIDPALATAFRAEMDKTGMGNNPTFVKAVWKLAQLAGEGKAVAGNGPSPHGQTPTGKVERPSAAQALYPKLPTAAG